VHPLIIPTVFLLLLTAAARISQGSWAAPGAFFTLFWVVLVILSYVVPEYPVWAGSLWWIVATCFTFYVGSLTLIAYKARRRGVRVLQAGRSVKPVFLRLRTTLIACFLAGLLYTLAAATGVFVIAFGERPPLAYQALLSFHFAGPLLGGMALGARMLQRGWRWVALLPLLPPAILAVMFTGRMALIGPCLYAIAGYFSGQVLTRPVVTFSRRQVIAGAGLLVAFVAFAVALDTFRTADVTKVTPHQRMGAYSEALEWDTVYQRWPRLRPAVFGQVYSFSYFFAEAWHAPPPPRFGSVIFAGPLDLLGLGGARYPFEEFEVEPGVLSNIFTMLRPPIEDFGLFGSLAWWLLIGILQGWAYSRTRSGSQIACVVLSWFYVEIAVIGGFFFRYNVIILGNLLVFLYLWYSFAHARRIRAVHPAMGSSVFASSSPWQEWRSSGGGARVKAQGRRAQWKAKAMFHPRA